ncbi:MAG: class I SAM-dependent methyltransferase [Methanomicrobiaceae archaeon]|nr:class I SAM-dependent methyltransferase [Methanomicrobiaceae archaeon]
MSEDVSFIREREQVLLLAEVEGREILDIGAGPLARIAVARHDCFVTSVDISKEALEEAEQDAVEHGVAEKISFEQEDAADLSYGDETFDIGICFCALHHIPEKMREPVVLELFRVVYERMVIAEFTPEEFGKFHADSSHAPVDLAWLEEVLSGLGEVSVHPLGTINAYVIRKR